MCDEILKKWSKLVHFRGCKQFFIHFWHENFDSRLHYDLAIQLQNVNKEDACDHFSKSIKYAVDPETALDTTVAYAEYLMNIREYTECMHTLNKAMRLKHDDPRVNFMQGKMYSLSGDLKTSMEYLNQAKKYFNSETHLADLKLEIHSEIAQVYREENRHEEAKEEVQTAIKVCGDDSHEVAGKLTAQLIGIELDQGNQDVALKKAKQLLK